MTADPHVLEPGHAPTPFTADEIRRGCPSGRTIAVLVERSGEDPYLKHTRFVECDEHGALQETWQSTPAGETLGPHRRARSEWQELQAHASFPADGTTITEESLDTPMGRLECLRYDVGGGTAATFWFARAFPGMPVRYESFEQGELVQQVTMVESRIE